MDKVVQIELGAILLDGRNPRHDPVEGNREVIRVLLEEVGDKVVELADDIWVNGVSPIDLFLVITTDQGLFVVVEGNRRIAAMKLLLNPGLADGHPLERKFRKIVGKQGAVPSVLNCVIASSREEARHWIRLRHGGELGGRGVVPWNAVATQRFSRRKGSHGDRALLFIDSMERIYAEDRLLIEGLEKIRRERITTLGRLVSDPYVRGVLGLRIDGEDLKSYFSSEDLWPVIKLLVEQISGSVTVSHLKSKLQRKKHADQHFTPLLQDVHASKVPAPLEPLHLKTEKHSAEDHSTDSSKGSEESTESSQEEGEQSSSSAGRNEPKVARYLFQSVTLPKFGGKIGAILAEVQRLDVDKYPNAAAVLMRGLIELTVTHVAEERRWNVTSLREKVKKCVKALDPQERRADLSAVRRGLNDGTSVLAVSTLHKYVHNPHFHPTSTELRAISANYTPFLAELGTLIQ